MLKRHKIAIISISIVAVLFFFTRWYVTRNSISILEKIVAELSHGKYRFQASSVNFSLLSSRISGTGIQIHPVSETIDEPSYQIEADTILIELRSIWPLIMRRSLLIENIVLANPSLVIKGKNQKIKSSGLDFNLHEYLQVIHEETNTVIHELRLEHFRLENFSLKILTDQDRYFFIDRVFMEINELFANVQGNKISGNYELEGGIHLWLDKPIIVYPDSNLRVNLDSLDWLSQKHRLSIENISLFKRRSKESPDSVFFQLHAVNGSRLDWNEWINNGRMKIDSIGASTGNLYMDKLGIHAKDDTIERRHSILKLISPISVNHFAVRALHSNLSLQTKNGPVTGSLKGDSLLIDQLSVDIVQKISVQLQRIDMAVREFTCKDSAGKWNSGFQAFHIKENQVVLRGYSMQSDEPANPGMINAIRIPSLTLNGLSLHDLNEGKLTVKNMSLESPYVKIVSNQKSGRAGGYRPFREVFPFLNIQSIFFKDGIFILRHPKTGASLLEAKGINGHLYANKLLAARSLEDYPATCDKLQARTIVLNLARSTVNLSEVSLVPNMRLIRIGKTMVNSKSTGAMMEARGMKATLNSSHHFVRNKKDLYFDKLSIDSFAMRLDQKRNRTASPAIQASNQIALHVKDFQVTHGLLDFKNENQIIHTKLNRVAFSDVEYDDSSTSWQNADARFYETSVEGDHWNFTAESIDWSNHGLSTAVKFQFDQKKEGRSITATIPRIKWSWVVHKPVLDESHLSLVILEKPGIQYQKRVFGDDDPPITTPTRVQPNSVKKVSFVVDSVLVTDANLKVESFEKSSPFSFASKIDYISLSGARYTKNTEKQMSYHSDGFGIQATETSFQKSGGAQFSLARIQAEGRSFGKEGSSSPLSSWIDTLVLDSLHFSEEKENKKTRLSSAQIKVTQPTRIYGNKDSILHMLYGVPSLSIHGTDLTLDRRDHLIEFRNINANLPNKTLALDSFSFRNKISRDSFFSSQPFEKDYITVNTGPLQAKEINVISDLADSGFLIGKISVDRLYLKAERDKRMPDDTVQYRPLLVKLIQRIPVHIAMDTLALQHSTIWHNVIPEKTGEEGTIYFTDLNGWIADLRNFRLKETDSLRIRVSARMMGKGDLLMRFRESYLDSLQGFLLTARMGGYEMSELNRILVPLALIRIAGGKIDTLWMQAKANDLLGFGQMQIHYHKLKVEKLDAEQKKQGFISWVANIIVRTGNRGKTGTIYVERLQNKSTFNYWGKIALSGFLTNIRVASNKRNQMKYEAALKKNQLPPHLLDND